ncbi:hypothetical protein [Paenibacillus lautus]|uniref:hypothetical protein n=1 Tax=Paenibacillus lautus TaxID=1401 RepID=UPI003D280C2F
MNDNLKLNNSELQFLSLAYNAFYDIYEEILDDNFWSEDQYFRFSRARDAFSIYAELLNYEPIKWVIEHMKTSRPPMEAEIGSELFKFIRNVIAHFPFYNSWDDIWISKGLVNWYKEGRFLRKYAGRQKVKYRFWQADIKRMTYLSIGFPEEYTEESKIYMKDILTEEEGIKFSMILMRQILDTQVIKE